MVIRSIIMLALVGVGVFIGAGMLHESGIINGLFTDEADRIRAEAELKRVNVELLKAIHDHEERKALIAAAIKPRTPAFVTFCMVCLCLLCGALAAALVVFVTRERVRAEFGPSLSGKNRGPIGNDFPCSYGLTSMDTPSNRFALDQRDFERGGA